MNWHLPKEMSTELNRNTGAAFVDYALLTYFKESK